MKKKWLKKGSAILLAAAIVMSLFPGMTGTLATVQAAENEAPTSGYWTDATGLKGYNLSSSSTTIGKIKFGADDRLWAICGTDGDNLALLSTSEFAQAEYGGTSEYSNSNFVENLTTDSNGYLSTTYFSTGETGKMADVTVSTNEPDVNGGNTSISVADKKLYLPNSQNEKSYGEDVTTIYVGSSNNIAIDVKKLIDGNGFQTNLFWLRSPYFNNSYDALVAYSGSYVFINYVNYNYVSVVPAFNLNLSSDIFASAAEAASSTGYIANSDMTENTYTLRYTYTTGIDSAVINPSGTQVKVTNANNKYLMVQNSTGVYALEINSDDKTINASDIQMGSNAEDKLDNFNNCKVWIESTDENRITTAKMATQATVTTINSVEVTGIIAPMVDATFDTEAACATTGISSTTPTVTWTPNVTTAGYNTTYTASVTLTTADDYEFASEVAATVKGENATSVTKNDNGTVTVTYEFPATDMAKLISITAPSGITVANGTTYAAMGLPANVAIVTEGNTETTATVAWDTTAPNSGIYSPELLTEQTVTLNGAVICSSNIDQNNVPLTTTITVTISAAGIVGAPTFAPAAGTYTENQSVALSSSTDGATIYYTTDGTTPTTGGNVYSGAISVTGTAGESISTTIKAIAVKAGMQTSSVVSATYVIEIPAPTPSTYAVTVNNGTGDGSYATGATVTITADAAPSGQEFDKWTVVSGGVTLASATSAETTFTMPANAVEVTATYKNKPSDPTPPAPNPPAPTYIITTGAGGTHELSTDGTLTITCDGTLDKLTGIYVDDKLVDAANYTLKSGSTILTFKAAYLNTLSVGTHKVRFQYNDESAETTFVIKQASTEDTTQETTTPSDKDEVPKTGDSTPIAWLFVIAIISGAGVVYFGKKKKTAR